MVASADCGRYTSTTAYYRSVLLSRHFQERIYEDFVVDSALALALLVATASAAPVTLALKFTPGQVEKMAVTNDMDQTISADVLPALRQQKIKLAMESTLKVIKADKDGATVDVTFDHVAMSLSMLGNDMSFDSAKDKPDPANPLSSLSGIVGVKLTLHFTPAGKVDKVEGADAIAKKLGAAPGGAVASKFVGEDQVKQMFNMSFADSLPAKPVAVGDTWENNISENVGGMALKMKNNNKLAAIDSKDGHEVAKIEFTGEGKLDGNAPGGAKVKVTELSQKGTKLFDIERGCFSSITGEQTMKGAATVPGPSGDIKMKMDVKVKSKTTFTPGSAK